MNRNYIIFTALGFELVGIIFAMWIVGDYLDKQYALRGMGVAGALLLGLVGWMVKMMWLLKRIEKDSD